MTGLKIQRICIHLSQVQNLNPPQRAWAFNLTKGGRILERQRYLSYKKKKYVAFDEE